MCIVLLGTTDDLKQVVWTQVCTKAYLERGALKRVLGILVRYHNFLNIGMLSEQKALLYQKLGDGRANGEAE